MRLRYLSVIALTLVGVAVLLPPEPEVASVPAPVLRDVKPRPVSDVYFTRHMVDRFAVRDRLAIRWYAGDDEERPSEEEFGPAVPVDWCGTARLQQLSVLELVLPSGLWARVKRIGEWFSE